MINIIVSILLIIMSVVCVIESIQLKKMSQDKIKLEDDFNNAINTLNDSIPTINIKERLELTEDLLGFIDGLINDELISRKRNEIFLNTPNKNIDFDTVIKDVSTSVFVGLKEYIFSSSDLIITGDYLIKYIQKRTVLNYLVFIEKNTEGQLS